MRALIYSTVLAMASADWAAAQVIFTFDGLNRDIPDGSSVGIVDSRAISGAGAGIAHLAVTLSISGRGFGANNGDLYATLVLNDTPGFSVLLNRPGREGENPVGYGDNGLNLRLDDGSDEDIHTYQMDLIGPLGTAPLTGVWQPDGRHVDPADALDTSPRTAQLSSFVGLDPNGIWTLFVADVEPGGTARLDSWGLVITPVPEPNGVGTLAAWTLALFGTWLRLAQRRVL